MAHRITAPVHWDIIGRTVRGPAHEAVGLPNQDAILWQSGDGTPGVSVLAVSDGHGNRKCFRSDTGSQFAVKVAIELFDRFGRQAGDDVPSFSTEAQSQFARSISETWNRRVDDDIHRHPFTKQDEAAVEAAEEHGFMEVAADPLLAYGATLLVVLLAPGFALYAQIGDGDILVVGKDGSTRRVFRSNASLPLNVTNSLCQHDAWRNLHFELVPFDESIPELIVATTDGYVNSFSTDEGFLQVGRDLRAMIESDGLAAIERRLTAILVDASSAGSRDDVTLGIIKRLDENQPARDDTTENARSRAREAPPDASYLAAAPYGKASSYREDTPIAELAAPRRSAESSRSEVIRRDRLARDESRRWALRIVLIAAFALAIVAICAIAVPWPRLLHHFFHASPGTPNTAGEIAKADAILDQLDAPPPVAVDGQADSGHKVVDDTKTDQTPLLKHALELYRKAAQGDPASVKALRGERYVYERLHDWSDAARIASNVIIVDGAKAAARSDAQNDLRELIYAISGGDQSRSLHNLQLVKTLGAGFDAQSKPLRPAGSASPVPEPSSALKPAPHKTPADSMP